MSETINYKGYNIEIEQDMYPPNPRIDQDNGTVMICFHKKYILGDKHCYNSENYNSWDEIKSAIIKKEKPIVILPLYLYDHSGITISTTPFSCNTTMHAYWDSGQVGFVFINKAKCKKMGWNEKWANKMSNSTDEHFKKYAGKTFEEILTMNILGEVETYDQYLAGDVYSFEIEFEDGEIDSCGGFFGSDHEKSGLLYEAKSLIDRHD